MTILLDELINALSRGYYLHHYEAINVILTLVFINNDFHLFPNLKLYSSDGHNSQKWARTARLQYVEEAVFGH